MVPNKSDVCLSALPLPDLIEAASLHLQSLGYSPHTRYHYHRIWRRMALFHNTTVFSQQLAEEFLVSLGVRVGAFGRWKANTSYQQAACAAIRILSEFKSRGWWHRRRVTRIVELPDALESVLTGYREHFLRNIGGSTRTLACCETYLRGFLEFLRVRVGADLRQLQTCHLSAFISHGEGWAPATIARCIGTLKSFCRYLFMSGVVPTDLSNNLPHIRIASDRHIPTVWTHAQVEAILTAVDRSSPRGKRDYAILLLACRLGLRCEDIRRLCLENLRWAEGQIVITQSKTGTSLMLPLLEDVGAALIDYLRYGRPKSPHREVFLRACAPIEPLANNVAFWNIMNNHRRLAGVAGPPGAPHGMHSLRHTMATHLLEAGNSLEMISHVLGHASVESTRIYTKVNIEALRTAALSVEEVAHA